MCFYLKLYWKILCNFLLFAHNFNDNEMASQIIENTLWFLKYGLLLNICFYDLNLIMNLLLISMYVYVSMRAKALQAYIALPWFLEMVLIWVGHCISEKWMFFLFYLSLPAFV